MVYNSVLLAGGQNERNYFKKELLGKWLSDTVIFSWDSDTNFVSKLRNMKKVTGEMLKALICHVGIAVTPIVWPGLH